MGFALGCWIHVPQRLPLSYAGDILKQAAAMSRPPSTQQLDEEKKRLKAALLSPSSDTAMVHHSPIGRCVTFDRKFSRIRIVGTTFIQVARIARVV
jgi:hypothetical protein